MLYSCKLGGKKEGVMPSATKGVMPSITVELPTKEYPIVKGPPEKILMFQVFEDIERSAPPPCFTVLDEHGRAHEIYANIHLVGRTIANQHDFERYAACYYLAGMKVSHLDFLETNFHFAAIYSVPSRTGKWIVIPDGGNAFNLPGNHILDYLSTQDQTIRQLTPAVALKGAEGLGVKLFLKQNRETVEGRVKAVSNTDVTIDLIFQNRTVRFSEIKEALFA